MCIRDRCRNIRITEMIPVIATNFTISLENPATPSTASEIRFITNSTPPDTGKPDYGRKLLIILPHDYKFCSKF